MKTVSKLEIDTCLVSNDKYEAHPLHSLHPATLPSFTRYMSSNRSYYGEASDSPERALLLPENERQPQAVPKKETFADLKPYIRPLIATNFISVICGLNDGSIVSMPFCPMLRRHNACH